MLQPSFHHAIASPRRSKQLSTAPSHSKHHHRRTRLGGLAAPAWPVGPVRPQDAKSAASFICGLPPSPPPSSFKEDACSGFFSKTKPFGAQQLFRQAAPSSLTSIGLAAYLVRRPLTFPLGLKRVAQVLRARTSFSSLARRPAHARSWSSSRSCGEMPHCSQIADASETRPSCMDQRLGQ